MNKLSTKKAKIERCSGKKMFLKFSKAINNYCKSKQNLLWIGHFLVKLQLLKKNIAQ